MTTQVDLQLAARRKQGPDGLTTRERQVLALRWRGSPKWIQIAKTLKVSRFRVTEIKRNLIVKGMLDPAGQLTEQGRQVVDGNSE